MRSVIERIRDVPAGIVGLRASGKLSKADYRDVLEPALREGLDAGELRVLFVLSDLEGLEPGAWIEDVKTGLEVLVGHHAAWKRFALVTDVDWVARAERTFTWLIPGGARVFDPGLLEDARAWVAGQTPRRRAIAPLAGALPCSSALRRPAALAAASRAAPPQRSPHRFVTARIPR